MHNASLIRRFMARIIDAIIVGVVITIIMLLTSAEAIFNLIKEGTAIPLTLRSLIDMVQVGLVIGVFMIIYYVSIPVRNNGQTIGKKMMRIRVVKTNGKEVDFATLFYRETISDQLLAALTFMISLPINALLAIYRKDKRSVSDIFAKTRVIFVEEEEK